MTRTFPMTELRSLVAHALASCGYEPAKSGRIRDVPDTRTIRYYTTLGLIGRPVRMRGRTAFYDETHVQQIVAIKRLQGEELTLSDIQQRLAGLPPKEVARIAGLPANFWEVADQFLDSSSPSLSPQSIDPDEAEPAFRATPAALPAVLPGPTTGAATTHAVSSNGVPETPASLPASSPRAVRATARIQIHQDVELLIDVPAETDVVATIDEARLRTASQALLDELLRQGLLQSLTKLKSPMQSDAHD